MAEITLVILNHICAAKQHADRFTAEAKTVRAKAENEADEEPDDMESVPS